MDRPADILEGGVARDPDAAGAAVDLDVTDMRAEAALGTGGVGRGTSPDRPAGLGRPGGELGERQRIELAGVVAGGLGLAVVPGDGVGIDLPDLGRALAQLGDDLLRRLRHYHRGGEGDAAAAG